MSAAQIDMLEEILVTSDDEALVAAAEAKLHELRSQQSGEERLAQAKLDAMLVDVEVRAANASLRKPTVHEGVRDSTMK